MSTQFKPDPNEKLALVVFGRDAAGKAHASSFTEAETKLAEKAAEVMKLRLLPVRNDVEAALAARVPRGKVFASGKAFVPFIKASLFLELQTAALNSGIKPLKLPGSPLPSVAPVPQPSASAPAAPTEPSKNTPHGSVKQPCGWADIQVGATVLTKDPPNLDWYEAEVIAMRDGDLFTLRWCDWPELPPFVRRRVQLALMHPACPRSAA
jgi:hypothetical protein